VDIQRARFQDRLEVTYNIERECERVDVPAFVMQPLVENVLRHGLADRRACHVEIGAADHDGNEVRLWVRDDGTGLPTGFDLERHAGTGLSNIATRLKRLYGAAASLVLRPNSPAGTIVELTLPRRAHEA
jgi:LytS/YehU family sensor histidine kinase